MSFNSQELVSQSTLTASSTSADAASCYNNSCDINNIKQTAPNDASNHLTMWKSDGSCGAQTIRSDWGSLIPQSISSLSVLYTPDSSNANVKTQTVVLSKKDGSTVDVSNYLLCTTASVSDAGKPVRWDICALSSSAPGGTYDNVVGALLFSSQATLEAGVVLWVFMSCKFTVSTLQELLSLLPLVPLLVSFSLFSLLSLSEVSALSVKPTSVSVLPVGSTSQEVDGNLLSCGLLIVPSTTT
ncbi:hypothetical protein BCR33DRAFT_715959, partial [Rhizoclosmatium globosum]